MSLGDRIMNLRGITVVIVMVGLMGCVSILGMVVIAALHDGDITSGVITNLQTIAVSAVTASATLIAHYIGAGAQTQQQQQQFQAQAATAANTTPTVTVPVAVTPVAGVTGAAAPAGE